MENSNQKSLNTQIANFIAGNYAIVTKENAAEIGWTEYTCRANSLQRKTRRSFNQLKIVANNLGHDIDTIFATLKNVEPTEGKLYDIIELRSLEDNSLIMTIVPKSGIEGSDGNGFVVNGKSKKKSFEGKWSAIKEYFIDKHPNDSELTLRRNLPGCPKDTKFIKHGKTYQNELSDTEGSTDIQYKFTKTDIENHKKWFNQEKVEFETVPSIYSKEEVELANSEPDTSEPETTESDTSEPVVAKVVKKSEKAKSAEIVKSAADAIDAIGE